MKKILVAAMTMLCATALVVSAQDAAKLKKKKLTAEQQTLQKDMLAKYDTNKDGKLDKTERAAISKEDTDRLTKAGLLKVSKKNAASNSTGTTTNAPAH